FCITQTLPPKIHRFRERVFPLRFSTRSPDPVGVRITGQGLGDSALIRGTPTARSPAGYPLTQRPSNLRHHAPLRISLERPRLVDYGDTSDYPQLAGVC